MYWGLAGTLGTHGPEGVYKWGHQGHWGVSRGVVAILGVSGASGDVGMSGVYWGLGGILGTQGPEGV